MFQFFCLYPLLKPIHVMSLEVRYLSTSERARRLVEEGLKLLEMSSLDGKLIVTSDLDVARELLVVAQRFEGLNDVTATITRIVESRSRSPESVLYLYDNAVLLFSWMRMPRYTMFFMVLVIFT